MGSGQVAAGEREVRVRQVAHAREHVPLDGALALAHHTLCPAVLLERGDAGSTSPGGHRERRVRQRPRQACLGAAGLGQPQQGRARPTHGAPQAPRCGVIVPGPSLHSLRREPLLARSPNLLAASDEAGPSQEGSGQLRSIRMQGSGARQLLEAGSRQTDDLDHGAQLREDGAERRRHRRGGPPSRRDRSRSGATYDRTGPVAEEEPLTRGVPGRGGDIPQRPGGRVVSSSRSG